MTRVLVIDDEPSLVFMLTDRLEAEGYAVDVAMDGDTGLARALDRTADVIVLDGMLPGRDGLDVCRILRQRGVTTPVLMLSARGQVMDRVVGLRFGADDYLVKPFEFVELLARIDALTRRTAAPRRSADVTCFGDVVVSRRETSVSRGGVPVELTALEFKLLVYFLDHPLATFTRDQLLDAVWGYQAMPTTRTVDVHVGVLRRKLEPDPPTPRYFLTVHGVGYKFAG
jgi:two-component system alkaline phosphatase synthesis response regulator PhoP